MNDWILTLIGMIVWDIVRTIAIVQWTARKVRKDNEKDNAG